MELEKKRTIKLMIAFILAIAVVLIEWYDVGEIIKQLIYGLLIYIPFSDFK